MGEDSSVTGGRDREWPELMGKRGREIGGLVVRRGLGPDGKAVAPGSINEGTVDVDAGDDSGGERLGDGDGKMAVVGADVEDETVSEDGGWEAVEAEERSFIVVMVVVSVNRSHIFMIYSNMLSIIARFAFSFRHPPRMAALHTACRQLAIEPIAVVDHDHANSPQAWRDLLLANDASPKVFSLIKTLVYKPKTAKSAIPVPVVVVASDETQISSSAIGKAFNLKELRLASEDLLKEFFHLDKNACASLITASVHIADFLVQCPRLH